VGLRVVCRDTLDCLAAASISKAFVVISDHKFEIMRFLSDGRESGIDLAYLHQRDPSGLAGAVDCAYSWIRNNLVALLLPDTVLEPRDTVTMLLSALHSSGSDLVLGVFPTSNPGELCPVQFDEQGRILGLFDKDSSHGIMNTWGAAVWKPAFSDFLHEHLQISRNNSSEEPPLSDIIMASSRMGLDARAIPIPGGRFIDVGQWPAIEKARQLIEDRRLGAGKTRAAMSSSGE
jgi:glucose-1-phosphate thymidylyltransferase